MGPWTHQCLTLPDENGQDAFLAGVYEGLARGGVWDYVGVTWDSGFKGLGFNWGLGVAFEDYIGKPKSCLYCSMICICLHKLGIIILSVGVSPSPLEL